MRKKYFNSKNLAFIGALLLGTASYGQVITTFDYTGGEQTFVVPAGVVEIQFDVMGAEGGDIEGVTIGWGGTSDIDIDAGNGGQVTGLLPVTPGETLYLYVGGEGSELSGGYNGGGDVEVCGGTEVIAAGGGGASDIRQGGTGLANRAVVAGGGGGVAGNGASVYKSTAGSGAGGGLAGQDAELEYVGSPCIPGAGGSAVAGGIGGNNSCWCGGGLTAGSGALGLGGNSICAPSGLSTCSCGGTGCTSGGGGGGGYYGGGAGICYAGGGGGSSYTDPGATDVEHSQGSRIGNGQIIITVLCSPITVTVSDTEICLGETFTLDGEGEGEITWDMGVEDDVEFEPLTTGITTYTATSDDPDDCAITVDIEVFELPDVTGSVDEAEICVGESIVLTGGGGADEYEWLPLEIEDGEDYTPDVGEYTYTVIGTDDETGCENFAEVEVTVYDLPEVVATATDEEICLGESVALNGEGATDYVWDPEEEDGVEFTPDETGTTTYTVEGTDDNGCSNDATIDVTVYEALEITYTTTDEILGSEGEINITVTGGSTPYSFDWDTDGTGDFDDDEDLTGLTGGTYTVVVMCDAGCSITETITLGSQVGIDELNGSLLSVFPNPTVNEITITLEGNFTYELIDTDGKHIMNGTALNQKMISMADVASGTYFVKVVQENSTKTIQVLKQ